MNRTMKTILLAGLVMIPGIGMAQTPAAGSKAQEIVAQREEIEKSIGLSQEQKDKMKAFREEFNAKQGPLQEQLRNKRNDLGSMLEGDSPDRAKIEAVINEINSLQGQIMLNNADLVLKTRGLMTPEQVQKVKMIREERRAAAAKAPETAPGTPVTPATGKDKKKK